MNNKSSRAQDFQKLQTAFQQSYSYEYEGNLPKAIESLKSDYQDNSYEINLRLGWLSYLQGLFTEAIAYYQKSIDIQPLSIEARFGYIYPAAALNHWEAVKRTYEEILKIDKQNKIANYRLGLIYYNDENYEAASKYLQNVINLYPFDYDGLLMFAWTNLKSGKFREAKILFNKVLLYQPNDKSALEGLSMIK
jgi:tetratricopeptide (TPR) repeat protein